MVKYVDADVARILAAHGIAPRADGYSLMDLEAIATTPGWQWSIEPVSSRPAGGNPKKRVRAMVIAPGDDGTTSQWEGKLLGLRQTRGTGSSDVSALALALARMLGNTTTGS